MSIGLQHHALGAFALTLLSVSDPRHTQRACVFRNSKIETAADTDAE
jgi:hypothetical protein